MTKPKLFARINLFMFIAIIAGGAQARLAPMAMAQEAVPPSRADVIASIEECRAISVAFMRQACLEAANQFLQARPEISDAAPALPAISTPPPTAPDALNLAETRDIESQLAAIATERAALEKARAELESTAQQSQQARTENERLGLLTRLGLARNVENTEEKIAATITIERATYNRQKIYTFYTSEGDILRQNRESLSMRLPKSLPATATLDRRTFGSKWLTFTDIPDRSYKVKILTPK